MYSKNIKDVQNHLLGSSRNQAAIHLKESDLRPPSFFLAELAVTKKISEIKLINESADDLTPLTEPWAQIAFFTLMASLII